MLAPSAEETERLGQEVWPPPRPAKRSKRAMSTAEHEAHHDDTNRSDEVELGIYNITRFNPATNTTLAIDFELFGTVLADDETEFRAPFRKQQSPHSRASDDDAARGRRRPT